MISFLEPSSFAYYLSSIDIAAVDIHDFLKRGTLLFSALDVSLLLDEKTSMNISLISAKMLLPQNMHHLSPQRSISLGVVVQLNLFRRH
jgi:hypothetical protein